MKRRYGFTLVELLVVIAIISILASIVVPNVGRYIARGRVTKAASEIRGAELALTQVLADAEVNSFRNLLKNPGVLPKSFYQAEQIYQNVFYQLLRTGRDTPATISFNVYPEGRPDNPVPVTIELKPELVRKLSPNYMDIGKDPWGQLYRFYAGPYRDLNGFGGANIYCPFRIYTVDSSADDPKNAIPGGGPRLNTAIMGEYFDKEEGGGVPIGWEAPKNLNVYIYSTGADMLSAQAIYEQGADAEFGYNSNIPTNERGGGDDVNNWDKTGSWGPFYR